MHIKVASAAKKIDERIDTICRFSHRVDLSCLSKRDVEFIQIFVLNLKTLKI